MLQAYYCMIYVVQYFDSVRNVELLHPKVKSMLNARNIMQTYLVSFLYYQKAYWFNFFVILS